jgi:hypothetical protein
MNPSAQVRQEKFHQEQLGQGAHVDHGVLLAVPAGGGTPYNIPPAGSGRGAGFKTARAAPVAQGVGGAFHEETQPEKLPSGRRVTFKDRSDTPVCAAVAGSRTVRPRTFPAHTVA